MKKKLLGGLLAVITLTTLVGCSSSNNKNNAKNDNKTTEVAKNHKKADKKSTDTKSDDIKDKPSNSAKLEVMVAAAQSQIRSVKEQQKDTYSDITVTTGENNTVVYTYMLKNQSAKMDSAALKPELVKQTKTILEAIIDEVPDAKLQFIYLNPDKSEVANIVVTKDDIDNIKE